MRLACPACAAEYDVPDAVLAAAPRAMRCARCNHVWVPESAAPESVAPESVAPESAAPEPSGREPASPLPFPIDPAYRAWATAEPMSGNTRLVAPEPPRRPALGAAWALTAVVLMAGLIGAVAQREAVMAAWPPAARAYAAVGLL